jgi:hypothetical protein
LFTPVVVIGTIMAGGVFTGNFPPSQLNHIWIS